MALLGAALLGAAGGLLGGSMVGDAPKRRTVDLDPATAGAISVETANAMRSSADIQKDLMAGVQEEGQMQGPVLTGGEPGINQAIQSKYARTLGEDIHRLKTGTEIEARQKQVSNQARAMQFNIAKKNVGVANMQRMMEAQIAEEQLRSKLLTTILGSAGQGIGYALGSKNEKKSGEA